MMKFHTKFKISILTFLTVICGAVNAGLILEKKVDPPAVTQPVRATRLIDQSAKLDKVSKFNRQRIDLESRVSSRITQSGTPPAELPALMGFGNDVTLEDALRQILPAGWSAFSDQDLDMDAKTDWQGTRTWPMALHTVLNRRDMRAHIDWNEQEMMLFVPQTKAGPQLQAKVLDPEAPRNTPPKTARTKGSEAIWELSPERSLRENFRLWANQAGWTLVWNAVRGEQVVDYPVDALIEFKGDAMGVSGAMARVIAAYADADVPLEIEFYRGNKVVEIRLHREQNSIQPAAK